MAQIGGGYASSWSTPKKKTYIPSLTGSVIRQPTQVRSVSVGPYSKPTPKPPTYTPPATVQSRAAASTSRTSSGGGGFDFGALMKGYQPTQWTPPGLPQEPQVSSQMIADWIARSKTEAGLQFDPQLLAIQQEFEKMMLGAEQAKGELDKPYQDIIDYVTKWQEEETGATQRRHYARGLGQGGGLIEAEGKIGETALKEVTAAGTERARKLGDIEEQKMLMMEQAGAKKEDVEAQRGRYVAARSADLEDSYVSNKRQLEQQRFANQMNIAQVGMTKEANDFNRWLGTMSLANDVWYREQTLGLERESMALSERARQEAVAYRDSQAKKDPYENMVYDKETGTWITTAQYYANKGNAPTADDDYWNQYEKDMAELARKQKEKEYSLTTLGGAGYTSPYSSSGFTAGKIAGGY